VDTPAFQTLRVVGALIERDGLYMVTRRPSSSSSWPGAWEFPGGKVEEGEQDKGALARELAEELEVEVTVGPVFHEVLGHRDGQRLLDFRVYRCQISAGEPATAGVDEIRWLRPQELALLEFPTADRPVVAAIIAAAEESTDRPQPGRSTIAP